MVARALGPINERVVYLGGCAVGLLVTDPAKPPVRATVDVDVIVEVASQAEYFALSAELRRAGFLEDQGQVICRWRIGTLQVDVIPVDPTILGFSNRWMREAVDNSLRIELPSGYLIRLISAPYLIATKLEAFYDRGDSDYRASHDLEDIVNLVDGRAELPAEIAASSTSLKDYLREEIDDLLANADFTEALPGHLGPTPSDQSRLGILIERFRRIAGA